MARRRPRAVVLLGVVVALVVLVALPGAAFAAGSRSQTVDRVTIADAPPGAGEDCVDDPAAHPGVGLQKCPTPFTLATLLPFVAGGVVVLLAIFAGWFLVMRRRASKPFLPDEAVSGAGTSSTAGSTSSSEWWTCRTCGKTNMVGSARCYSCGSWQR